MLEALHFVSLARCVEPCFAVAKFSMERAAFKFTPEYLAVLGGKSSPLYEEFVNLFAKGLAAARKYASVTVTMIEIMMFQVRDGIIVAVYSLMCDARRLLRWVVCSQPHGHAQMRQRGEGSVHRS